MRWLCPLDFDPSRRHRADRRLVVAHEANLTGGFGAEIAARAARSASGISTRR